MGERMRERVIIETRVATANVGGVVRAPGMNLGGVVGAPAATAPTCPWATLAGPMAARLQPLRGGEKVLAGRLAGVQAYVITIRSTSQLREVCGGLNPQARARNVRTGVTYNIRSVQNPDERNAYLALMAESGVVSG